MYILFSFSFENTLKKKTLENFLDPLHWNQCRVAVFCFSWLCVHWGVCSDYAFIGVSVLIMHSLGVSVLITRSLGVSVLILHALGGSVMIRLSLGVLI